MPELDDRVDKRFFEGTPPPDQGFFLKGAAALALLGIVSLTMESRPEVSALRAMILMGLAIIGVKVLLRRFNVDWPPRRNRHADPRRRPE